MVNRITSYGDNDLVNYLFWDERLPQISRLFADNALPEKSKDTFDLNDILELYNVGIGYSHFNDVAKGKYDSQYPFLSQAFHKAQRLFSSLDIGSMIEQYEHIELDYISDFWNALDKTKKYRQLSVSQFISLCSFPQIQEKTLDEILKHKDIVNAFQTELTKLLDDYPFSYRFIFNDYLSTDGMWYYFPKEYTQKHMDEALTRFIRSASPSAQYLEMVLSSDFPVSAEVKAEAKRKYEIIIHTISKDEGTLHIPLKIRIDFSPKQRAPFLNLAKDYNRNFFSYSEDFVIGNMSNEHLLQNFYYPFYFCDSRNRIVAISHEHDLRPFEYICQIPQKKHYSRSIYFRWHDSFYYSTLAAYCSLLERMHHPLEDILEWFYNRYLPEGLGITGFHINLLRRNVGFNARAEAVANCIEGIFYQYSCYVSKGSVDWDYIQYQPLKADYRKIPSLIKAKYFYGKGKPFQSLTYLLFSDQSILRHAKVIKEECNCFYDLICQGTMHLDDFADYQSELIQRLINKGYLYISGDGVLSWTNPYVIRVLRDLHHFDFCETAYYSQSSRNLEAIQFLQESDMILLGETLLSEQEGRYFNYYLNTISSSNGPQLRNLYAHGKVYGPKVNHEYNYYVLLRLLVLLTMKIYDELIGIIDWKSLIDNYKENLNAENS
nr:hypothetical protein [uncultured Dialister sp.]